MTEKNKNLTIENAFLKSKSDGMISFHMPGHKNNLKKFDFLNTPIGEFDSTEVEGLDNLQNPKEAIKNLLDRISKLFGSVKSFISLNGTTCSMMTSIFALTSPKDHVLIQRNSHKCVYNAIGIRELIPRYIVPEYIDEFDIYGSVTTESIEQAFKEDEDIKLVIITSPSYEGVISDVRAISDIVHKHGAKLLVDGAHGAHLGFGYGMPESNTRLGADVVCESLHKTMPSINPCSLIHVCSNDVDLNKMQKYLNVFQTSSPSYIALYSIEKLIDILEKDKDLVFRDLKEGIEFIKDASKKYKNIKILGYMDKIKSKEIFDFDYSKVCVCFGNLEGEKLKQIIREDYQMEPEYIEKNKVLFMLGPGDETYTYADFVITLNELDSDVKAVKSNITRKQPKLPNMVFNPYEIGYKNTEYVKFEDSKGRVMGEKIYNYPPGSPMIIEGEMMDESTFDLIKKNLENKENTLSDTGRFPDEILVCK